MERNALVKLSALATMALALSGCQSFGLTSWMFKKSNVESPQQNAFADTAADSLKEGATLLRQGNIAAAVSSYRLALFEPATAADAANGIAVAYAKLGRLDLAERYFLAAMQAQPDNPKFSANFLRLQTEVSLARRDVPQAPLVADAVASAQPSQAGTEASEIVTAPQRESVVQRISHGEVMIRTRDNLGNAPGSVRVASAQPTTQVASGERLVARVISQPPQYPIGVVLGE